MRRGRLTFLPLTIGPLLALAAAAPATAGTLPGKLPTLPTSHSRSTTTVPDKSSSAMAGFVYWSGSSVTHQTSYNSSGGLVTVTPGATGTYTVTFFGLGFHGGDVQVSAASVTATCSVDSWGASGPNLGVSVVCYSTAGAPVNSAFDLLVTQPHSAPHGVLDYDWVYTAHGALTGQYQYNSSHKTNSVTHPHTGQYVVTMPGPAPGGAKTGTVKVSAYGLGGGGCQVAAWKATSLGQKITVYCFSATGVPQNRRFTIVYARGNNLMGQNGKVDANALAVPGGSVYQPQVQYDSHRGARVTVAHLDHGIYEILFAGSSPTHHFSGGLGHIEVTAVGGTYRFCGFVSIPTHTPVTIVICANSAGHAVDSGFTVQWVVT